MNNENKLIPELRFPEFFNEGEWSDKELGKVADVITGNTPSTKEPKYYGGNIMFVSPADINGRRYISKTNTTLTELGYSKTRHIKENSVLFVCIGSTIGKVAQNKYECATNQQINSLIPFKDYSNDFIFSNLEHNAASIADIAGNQAVPIINKTLFSSVKLFFPPKKTEQQKIAACLSSLDDLIEAHNQKLEALKDHKKGLMQNLFPQNGEKVPKFRFPEFVNDGEWVENTLGGTVDKNIRWSFTGGPFGSNLKASDYTTDGFRIIQLQNIGDGEFNDESKIFTSKEKADELLSCNIYAGDIIISKMGDPVGRACIIPDNLTRCVMASDGIRLVVDEKNFSKYFIYTLINSSGIREAIESKSTGSTRKRIGLDVLRSIGLLLPKERDEQEKIATCLLTLDESIKAEAQRIEQLKEHKKGLMQGLFVNVNNTMP